MHWTIAACQMAVTANDQENLNAILKNIRRARLKNADVICFPESCFINEEDDTRIIKKEVEMIQEAAVKNNIHVIFGSYLVDAKKKNRNQVIVIDRKGNIVKRYNKENKYMAESERIAAGHRNSIFELDGVRCAVFICWDYAFPENMRELAAKGTDVIFCPSFLLSYPDTKNVLERMPQVRAFDTMSYFVMVDAFADDTFQESKICHPLYCMNKISKKPGMIYAKINTEEVQLLRKKFANMKLKKARIVVKEHRIEIND